MKDDPDSVLKLCEMYGDDSTPAILCGRVLALLKLGRIQDARMALEGALEYRENIAIELMRKKHKAPEAR